MRDNSRPALGALTGARFLAAMWVVLYHYYFTFQSTQVVTTEAVSAASTQNPFLRVLSQGHLAVDFFFLLSGFILAYTYVAADASVEGGTRAFWVARIARIYPVYLLGLLLGLGPYLASGHRLFGIGTATTAHLLLLQAWFPSTLEWNQPSWSLSVEAFFYLLFPLLLPFIARLNRRDLWRVVALIWVAFGASIFILYDLGLRYATLWWWGDVVRYNPLVSLPEFIIGMALGLLFVRGGAEVMAFRRFGERGSDVALLVVTALFVTLLLLTSAFGYNTGDLDSMAVFALPFLVALILLLAFGRGVLARGLGRPNMRWLGEISYGVYIVHAPIWWLLSALAITALHMSVNSPVLFIAYLAVVLLVAGASFVYLERPARRFIRSHWGAPKAVTTPA